MPDPVPAPLDRPIVKTNRLGALTIISLAFNALIFLVILIGIARHHHNRRPVAENDEGVSEPAVSQCDACPAMNFHHGWGMRPGGGFHRPGGPGMGEDCSPDAMNHGFGGPAMGPHDPDFPGSSGRPGFGGMGDDHPVGGEEMTDLVMLHLAHELALTDPQSASIRGIVQQQVMQFQKDRETARQARQKLIGDAKDKIRPILNADQQKQFDDLTAHFGMATPPPPPPVPPPAPNK